VLFVPIVSGFFPFHLDFVRAAGLLLALCGALSAAPRLLRSGLASLRLAMPLALAGSITSIAGALIGLRVADADHADRARRDDPRHRAADAGARRSEYPDVPRQDSIGAALGLAGEFRDPADGRTVQWRTHRTLPGHRRLSAGSGCSRECSASEPAGRTCPRSIFCWESR
jgi:hypothetical protein